MAQHTSQPFDVTTSDGRVGRIGPMPDGRVMITCADGATFVIDAERLKPAGDGTYRVGLTRVDAFAARDANPPFTER
jgi:hypothetical protein